MCDRWSFWSKRVSLHLIILSLYFFEYNIKIVFEIHVVLHRSKRSERSETNYIPQQRIKRDWPRLFVRQYPIQDTKYTGAFQRFLHVILTQFYTINKTWFIISYDLKCIPLLSLYNIELMVTEDCFLSHDWK